MFLIDFDFKIQTELFVCNQEINDNVLIIFDCTLN